MRENRKNWNPGEILKREGRGFREKIEWNCSTWNKVGVDFRSSSHSDLEITLPKQASVTRKAAGEGSSPKTALLEI